MNVFRADATGSDVRSLASEVTGGVTPQLSPDGKFVAFVRGMSLWVMDSDGTGAHQVAPAVALSPKWAPDSQQLVFVQLNATMDDSDLWIASADGSSRRQLTTGPGLEDSPAWSPNASKVSFLVAGNLRVINRDGSGELRVTNSASIQNGLDWSLDGSRIAFAEDGDIKTIPATGGVAVALSSGPEDDTAPRWSYDGSKISFRREAVGGATRSTMVANPDGTAP